jgi:hypothetical protein
VFNSVSEISKLRSVVDDLQDKLSALEKSNNTNIKEKIAAQKCAEELSKRLEGSTM